MVDVVVCYIEQWGTRIRRIVKECDDKGLVFSTIKEGGNYFKIVLYSQLDHEEVPINADKIPINHKVGISENEELILAYSQSNEFITNKIARAQIGRIL